MNKSTHALFFFIACYLLSNLCLGQATFSNCSAIFLNNKMLVSEYSATAKCSITANAKGQLTVSTVNLSPNKNIAVKPIDFQVATKDKNTGTVVLVSKEKIQRIDIESILKKCKKGDSILILTLDSQYALPHNEVLVK